VKTGILSLSTPPLFEVVIPVKTGIQWTKKIPACAGMTEQFRDNLENGNPLCRTPPLFEVVIPVKTGILSVEYASSLIFTLAFGVEAKA